MDLIEKLIKEKSEYLDLWIDGINKYLDYRYSDREISTDELWNITVECVKSLAGIAEICFRYSKFKDNWEYENFYPNFYGPALIIKSTKTNCEYYLGIEEKGIYLSSHLGHNRNLRFMNDNFWKLLLKLTEFDGFVYDENEFVPTERIKKSPELFRTNKSIIFRILRKHIFDLTETNSQYISGSVGELKILWLFNNEFKNTIKYCCLSFKILYKLNYDLWKISDQKQKLEEKKKNWA